MSNMIAAWGMPKALLNSSVSPEEDFSIKHSLHPKSNPSPKPTSLTVSPTSYTVITVKPGPKSFNLSGKT